jgi:hypothetical protein
VASIDLGGPAPDGCADRCPFLQRATIADCENKWKAGPGYRPGQSGEEVRDKSLKC